MYRDVLGDYGAEPLDIARGTEIVGDERLFNWLRTEFQLLPDILGNVSDYAAATCTSTLAQLLERQDCLHFNSMRRRDFVMPTRDVLGVPSDRVTNTKNWFVQEFWQKWGREAARKEAYDHLARVYFSLLFLVVFVDVNSCSTYWLTFFSALRFPTSARKRDGAGSGIC